MNDNRKSFFTVVIVTVIVCVTVICTAVIVGDSIFDGFEYLGLSIARKSF